MVSITHTTQHYNENSDSDIVSVLLDNKVKLRVELFNSKRHKGVHRAIAGYYNGETLLKSRSISRTQFHKLESLLLNHPNDSKLYRRFSSFVGVPLT